MWILSLETMWLPALLLLTFTSGSSGLIESKMLMAGLGGDITIKCHYRETYDFWESTHCLCKETKDNNCKRFVCTNGYSVNNRRVSIIASNAGSTSASVKKLEEKDTGIYWCGRVRNRDIEISEVVLLKVIKGSDKPIKRMLPVELGVRTNVTCNYSSNLRDYNKFFCKVISQSECSRVATSEGVVNQPFKRRFSITGQRQRQVTYAVKAKEEDDGEYWCGAARENRVEITEVIHLQISHESTATPFLATTLTTATSSTAAITSTAATTSTAAIISTTARDLSSLLMYVIIAVALGLSLLALLTVVCVWKSRRKIGRNEHAVPANTEDPPPLTMIHGADEAITYATLNIQSSTPPAERSATYANFNDASESVEYSTVVFRT